MHDSTIENMTAFVSAPRLEWVPYQVFLPITGFLISLSWKLLSIGRSSNFKNKVNGVYSTVIGDPVAENKLKNKLNQSDAIKNLLDTNFKKNISFDAGLGSYTQSVETSIVEESSTSYNLVIDESVALELGFRYNSVGIVANTKAFFQQDINSSLSQETATTTNISYTIKSFLIFCIFLFQTSIPLKNYTQKWVGVAVSLFMV